MKPDGKLILYERVQIPMLVTYSAPRKINRFFESALPIGVPLSSCDRLARTSFAEMKKTLFFASNMSIT